MPKILQLPRLCGQNIPILLYYYLVKKDQTNRAGVAPPPLKRAMPVFSTDVFPNDVGHVPKEIFNLDFLSLDAQAALKRGQACVLWHRKGLSRSGTHRVGHMSRWRVG